VEVRHTWRLDPEYRGLRLLRLFPPDLRSDNEDPISEKVKKRRGKRTPLKNNTPEKDKIRGTLVRLQWRAAAPGLKPLHLPRVRVCANQGFINFEIHELVIIDLTRLTAA